MRLDMPLEAMLATPIPEFAAEDYPDSWPLDGNELPLEYVFDPTSGEDGVTLGVPLALLPALPAVRLDWLVPGMLRDKVVALLRGLPKDLRRELVPIPDAADRFLASLGDSREGSLFERLARFVTQEAGHATDPAVLAAVSLPDALKLNLRVLDEGGRVIRSGRDLESLRHDLKAATITAGSLRPGHEWEREGVRHWDFGDIPEYVTARTAGVTLKLHPGVEDTGSAVRLKLYTHPAAAARVTRAGVTRLAVLAMPQQHEVVKRACAADRDLSLLAAAAGMGRALFDEIADRAVEEAIEAAAHGTPRTAAAFGAAVDAARSEVSVYGAELQRAVLNVLVALKEVRSALEGLSAPAFSAARGAIARQLADLLAPGWIRGTPQPWLRHLPKYLKAAARRAERLQGDVERDRRLGEQVAPYESAWRTLERARARAGEQAPARELEGLRWMIEEFRVSLFAQDLKTLHPVSAKRLDRQLQLARAEAQDPGAAGRAAART